MRAQFAVAASALVMVAGGACGGGPMGASELGWIFSDGRDCEDASVYQVQLEGPVACACGDAGQCEAACTFSCDDGVNGLYVPVQIGGGGEIDALGLTASGTPLYRGAIDFSSLAPATVTLYFTGGR